jgi:isoquinoline 1-oxidoreductase subunit beta
VAHVQGDRCEIWAPTQTPQAQFPLGARESAAMLLGIPPENVKVYVSLLGGGFGRKSQMDFVLEAVQLSKLVGAPVKVTWTREDEIHHGFYRPENQQLLRAAVAPDGTVSALLGRSVFQSYFNLFVPGNVDVTPFELDMGWTNLPFAIPNLRLEAAGLPSDLRIGWLRSVHNLFHAFALSSFVDELAQKAGTDTISMYRRMLGPNREIPISVPLGGTTPPITYSIDTSRIAAVVDLVAGMGLWGKAVPEGEGLGFAAHFCNSTAAALVMHVAVGADKVIHVKEVDYAIDCGTVVNPDGVRAQVEGGLVYALSAALFGEITLDAGKVVESNFNDYPVLRIDRMPKVNLVTVASALPPMGIGEPPTPVVAPALANAVFAATGTRVRELPFRKQGFG